MLAEDRQELARELEEFGWCVRQRGAIPFLRMNDTSWHWDDLAPAQVLQEAGILEIQVIEAPEVQVASGTGLRPTSDHPSGPN
jgi:hypothetical protein